MVVRLTTVLALLLMLSGCGINNIPTYDEQVKAAWSQVQNQYQRRADLIPNLVETVKGAADFEKSTLTQVIEARAKATSININPNDLNAQNLQQFQAAQSQLTGALSRLLVTIERYPELKATQNFRDLQAQLEGTENRITVARNNFNEAVATYNTHIRGFFKQMVLSKDEFQRMEPFQAEDSAQSAPAVKF